MYQTHLLQSAYNPSKLIIDDRIEDEKRTYHIQNMEDVQMIGLKKKVVGLESDKYMGISSMYNFRFDPGLGIGKAACKRIPCVCLSCLEILKIPWGTYLDNKEQPQYGVNEWYIYWRNFKGYNNWRVVDLITTNITSEDEEKVYEIILYGIEARMNERILIGNFGAKRTNDEATQGYYFVKWITELYIVKENTVVKGVEPQHNPFARKMICDAVFWSPIPNATDWYAPMSKKEGCVMIRLK